MIIIWQFLQSSLFLNVDHCSHKWIQQQWCHLNINMIFLLLTLYWQEYNQCAESAQTYIIKCLIEFSHYYILFSTHQFKHHQNTSHHHHDFLQAFNIWFIKIDQLSLLLLLIISFIIIIQMMFEMQSYHVIFDAIWLDCIQSKNWLVR